MPRAIPSVFSHFQRVIRRGNLNNKELTRIAAVFFYWCGKKEKQRCFSCFSHQWFDRFSNVSTSSHFTAFFAVACTRRVFSSRHRCSLTYTGSRGLRSRSLVESLMHRAFSSTTLCLERRVNWTTTLFFFVEFLATGRRWRTSASSAVIGSPVTFRRTKHARNFSLRKDAVVLHRPFTHALQSPPGWQFCLKKRVDVFCFQRRWVSASYRDRIERSKNGK